MNPQNLVLALSAALAFSGSADAGSASLAGVYTNVCVSPETLDQGGDEVQLARRPAPHGTFAWCAGGCVRSVMNDLRLQSDRLSFSTTEQYFTEQGAAAGSTTHHYSGTFKANSLTLVSSDDPDFGRVVLRHQSWKPDHLTLIGSTVEQSEWPSPVRRC
jgi:hypothetical protein